MKKQATTGKSSPPPKKPNPASIPPSNQSPIEEISDLLDNLRDNACVELTRRLLTAVPNLPSGAARSRALRLACWNADGVRGRKMELDHFLGKHGVDIYLLTETHLRSGQVFRLSNYGCHRTDRPTVGGGTAILVRRGIDHYAIPVTGLTHLEATAIHVMLASGPVKILAAYVSPSRPLIEADLSA
jgi:hypothetical protein